jgi:anti-sigma-K factor RskA
VNIKEYIESGVLEAYILGSLSEEETAMVEANIAKFPELGVELLAIEETMLQFVQEQSKVPPMGLEDKIWDSIQHTAANAGDDYTAAPVAPKTVPFRPEYRKPSQLKYAALWAGLIVSVAGNVLLFNYGNNNKEQIASLAAHTDKIEGQQKDLAGLVSEYQKAKVMMADTATQTIVMHTILKGHPMAATLYWSKDKGDAYVSVDGLPEPPKGMQYQVWAIQGGKPVSMGVLPNSMANTPAVQKINMQVMSSEAFAISLEKEGGSPTPTAQNIYVMGKV